MAKLDKAPDYESGDSRFDPWWLYLKGTVLTVPFFLCQIKLTFGVCKNTCQTLILRNHYKMTSKDLLNSISDQFVKTHPSLFVNNVGFICKSLKFK